MEVGQNLLLSILVGWTSIYQLIWGSLVTTQFQGFDLEPRQKQYNFGTNHQLG